MIVTFRAAAVLCALLGVAFTLPGCEPPPPAYAAPGPNPYPPVPPLQAEQRALPPVSEKQLIWHPGDWEWAGTGYAWRPGEWEEQGTHSNQYMPGQWGIVGGAWTWERGHWL